MKDFALEALEQAADTFHNRGLDAQEDVAREGIRNHVLMKCAIDSEDYVRFVEEEVQETASMTRIRLLNRPVMTCVTAPRDFALEALEQTADTFHKLGLDAEEDVAREGIRNQVLMKCAIDPEDYVRFVEEEVQKKAPSERSGA